MEQSRAIFTLKGGAASAGMTVKNTSNTLNLGVSMLKNTLFGAFLFQN